MDIFTHPSCTETIGAPSDMTDEQCVGLPVHYYRDAHGLWSRSFWKPNGAELKALAYGGLVGLNVRAAGRQHPVVSVGAVLDAQLTDHTKGTVEHAAQLLAAYEKHLPLVGGVANLRERLDAMIMALAEVG